jgi:hypothetical protein
MTDYAQINPGKHHLGYRFPTPVIIERLPMNAEDDHRVELKYKHSVVLNRVLYVGNVQVFDRSKGTIRVEGDAMYKSVVNKFDVFTDYNKIEAAVSDGEEIKALEEFADKILQFKQNTLYIINASDSIEILEGTHKHKGVSSSASVCKTDYGVAWANEHGCYLYNGRNIVDLLEKKGLQKIKESDWQSFVHTPMVGYFPRKRQLIVVDDVSTSGDGSVYLYDMVTGSWSKSSSAKFADAIKTNFINDWNGDLVHSTSDTPQKWSDASVSNANFVYKTKDIDFGQPSVAKKIYKVYVTYQGNAAALTCKYAINGDTDTFGQFYITGSSGSSTNANAADLCFYNGDVGTDDWVRAELIPSSSINNAYSFQLIFGGTLRAAARINDISIVYRQKKVK